MKRNKIVLLGSLLVFALAIATALTASAQTKSATNSATAVATNTPPPPPPAPPSDEEIKANIAAAIGAAYPGASITSFKKDKTIGTNDIYVVELGSGLKVIRASVTDMGMLVSTDEPSDINTFPPAANAAVRKAITGMGVKDNGVRLGRIYAEVQKNEAGEQVLAQSPQPVPIYGADVADNHGQPGKFWFKPDGTPVEKPAWAK